MPLGQLPPNVAVGLLVSVVPVLYARNLHIAQCNESGKWWRPRYITMSEDGQKFFSGCRTGTLEDKPQYFASI